MLMKEEHPAAKGNGLRLRRAIALVDYHVRRNKTARASHGKTWRAKHEEVKFLRL